MSVAIPRNSAINAYIKICALADSIRTVLSELVERSPIFNEFARAHNEIRQLHRGIVTILTVINVPLDQFIDLGLRTTEEAWENPPRTCRAAVEEIRRILRAMQPFVNLRNGRRHVPGYEDLVFGLLRISITFFE